MSAQDSQRGHQDGRLVRPPGATANDPTNVPGRGVAQTAWVIAPRAGLRCSARTYIANAAIHPANLFVLVGSVLLVANHWNVVTLAITLGVEVVFPVVMSRCAFFRRAVERGIEQEDGAAKRRARDALILQMAEAHREELGRIEAVLEDALANAERRRGAVLLGTRDTSAMARLTLSYIHLAVDHRACSQSLAMTDPDALQATIASLEAATLAQAPRARPLLQRWLVIAKRRAERWAEAHATLETIGHQLATITELTYLLHQEAFAASSSCLSAEVDGILAEFEHGEHAAREVASMGIVATDACEVDDALLSV
jgi:hypothetical protein